MAKMFYTLDEAAEKLACDTAQIKQMVEEGKLQQYRDRDQVMFKVDEVDQVDQAASGQVAGNEASSEIKLDDFDPPSSDKEDMIDLSDTGGEPAIDEASATASGVNLSDTATPGADESEKTQLSDSFAGEPSDAGLDAIGSGSGLLDLTQESDDTSLGSVELLDDAPSDAGVSSDTKMGEPSDVLAGSSTGIFDAAGGAESGAAVATDESLGDEDEELAAVAYGGEGDGGDGFLAGALAGVLIVLLVGVLVTLGAMQTGAPTDLTRTLADGAFGMWYLVLAGVCLALGVVGMFISRR